MVRRNKLQNDMLAHGLGPEDIEIGLGMIAGRKQSISLFDRKKLGASLEEFKIIKLLG